MNSVEIIGLFVVILTQIVVIAMTFQSLRERVKNLESNFEKIMDSHESISEIKAKLDLIIRLGQSDLRCKVG